MRSQTAPDRFRGVRQVTIDHPSEAPFRLMTHRPPPGIMQAPGFRPALRHLAARGLSFDAAVFHHQLRRSRRSGRRVSASHDRAQSLGRGDGPGHGSQDARGGVPGVARRIARPRARPNVVCKIGGLGLPFWGFGFEKRTRSDRVSSSLRPPGSPTSKPPSRRSAPDRCMMESNYSDRRPIVRLRAAVECLEAYRARRVHR